MNNFNGLLSQDVCEQINGQEKESLILSIKKKIHKVSDLTPRTNMYVQTSKFRVVRKLTEKALKIMKIKISAFSKEINEDKEVVRNWFKKNCDSDQQERILGKCKEWLLASISKLEYKQFFEVAQKYIKSEELDYNINLTKKPSTQSQAGFITIPFAYMLQNKPPEGQMVYEENLLLINLLIPLQFLTKEEDQFMNERLLWSSDNDYTEAQTIVQLTHIIVDLFNELYSEHINSLGTEELMTIVQLCYLQLTVQLDIHRKLQVAWQQLLNSEKELHQEMILNDGFIQIHLEVKDKFKETILWDCSNGYQSIDQFAINLVYEQQLDKRYAILISTQIRKQIFKYIESKLERLQQYFSQQLLADVQQTTSTSRFQFDLKSRINQQIKSFALFPRINQRPDAKFPQSQDLQILFHKNMDFLPQPVSKYFGFQVKKEKIEYYINMDDIRHNERKFNLQVQPNEYLEGDIFKEFQEMNIVSF